MLDGRDAYAIAFQTGRQPGVADKIRVSLDVDGLRKVDTPEHYARIRCSRPQRQEDLLAGVQSHTGSANDIFERALLDHELTL